MTALDRRAFMAATAASIAAPTALAAKECPTAGMEWITMSLDARNLAYNNVEHVGPDNARKKTEGWAAASKTLREQRPKHLDLAYGAESATSGTYILPMIRRRHASFTSMVAIGSAAARRSSPASPRVRWPVVGRRLCAATR
jgi:hypothetical protein